MGSANSKSDDGFPKGRLHQTKGYVRSPVYVWVPFGTLWAPCECHVTQFRTILVGPAVGHVLLAKEEDLIIVQEEDTLHVQEEDQKGK